MTSLVTLLFTICGALLFPVIALLLCLAAWCLVQIGGILREAKERRSAGPVRGRAFDALKLIPTENFFNRADYPGLLGVFSQAGGPSQSSPLHLDKLVADMQVAARARLVPLNMATRIGPMLGLMGTLIPMGPALIAMSSGDIEKMATDLVVAFSTTVLGLLIGGLAFALSLTRRRWYAQDLCDIEYVYQCAHGQDAKS